MRAVIVGAGGHAKVVIDILADSGEVELAGCTCEEAGRRDVLGVPVLGSDEDLPAILRSGVSHAFVAIGDNRVRARLLERVREVGFIVINVISPRAAVSKHVRLGGGIAIMPGAAINVDTVVEDGAIVNTGATVDHDCRIGRFAHIAPGCHLAGNVTVGEGAFLGAGSSVIPRISIGPWTVAGAGSAVVRDLPGYVTAVGVPAAIVRDSGVQP